MNELQLTITEVREFQFVIRWEESVSMLNGAFEEVNPDKDRAIDVKIVPLSVDYAKRVMGMETPYTHYVTVRRTGKNRQQILPALNMICNTPSVQLINIKII